MYKSIVITLSVVSIDYRIFIFSNMFGLADQSGVPGPQGAGAAPTLQWADHGAGCRLGRAGARGLFAGVTTLC